MSDRDDTKFAIGLALVLFGPGYATQLEIMAPQQSDPKWRDFYFGAAKVVRGVTNDPKSATDPRRPLE